MRKIKQAVILAGGLGSRIYPLSKSIPKPMIDINGKPFIYYLIERLEKYKFAEVLLLTGFKNEEFEKIIDYCKNFKIKIRLINSPISYNTSARLKVAYPELKETFLLMYGDNFLPFDFNKIWKNYINKKIENQLIAYKNDDKYSSSNIKLNKKNIVTDYDSSRKKNYDYVNIGFFILKKKYIKNISIKKNFKFEEVILNKLIKIKKISAYVTSHRYYSLSNLNRYFLTNHFFKNRNNFIFLDRDGVINVKSKKGEYVKNLKEFKWRKGSLRALKFLGKKNKRIIIISNQAGIALNKLKLKDLNEIHNYIIKKSLKLGAIVEEIIFCPHHWNDKCLCRKPKSGMFYLAQKKFNIDLTNSLFVGDQKTDKISARNAEIPYLHLNKKKSLYSLLKNKL